MMMTSRSLWESWACLLCLSIGMFSLPQDALATKRAFIVGITNYAHIDPSVNSTNDALLMRGELEKYGYSTGTSFIDEKSADLAGFTAAWTKFLATVNEGDDVVVYFSGHGFSYQGSNYLAMRDVPKDASHDDAVNYAKDVAKLADNLTNKFVRIGVFIIEACRNDPFGYKDHAIQSGSTVLNRLERSTDSSAIVVWYAASEGETSLAAPAAGQSASSLFTKILADNLELFKQTDIERFAKEIRAPVLLASPPDHQQHPWLASNLTFDWCFGGECPITDTQPQIKTFGSPQRPTSTRQVSVNPINYQAYITQSKLDKNAMFIGKRSRLANCTPAENNDSPFGCTILRALVNEEYNPNGTNFSEAFLNRPLRLETATNLRLSLPTQISATNNHALYACIVHTYPKGSEIAFSSIVALNYNDDTYYWGVTADKKYNKCAG